MRDYLIVSAVNPVLDACAMHPSGVCVCSDNGGNDRPWLFTEARVKSDKFASDELNMIAKSKSDKIVAQHDGLLHDGWRFTFDGHTLYVTNTESDQEIWVCTCYALGIDIVPYL